ncbi:MAG: YceD family protein [Cyanobacteria bacterium]|nr:YceD family protein [Cyanobacteriota bacterium]MDW8200836.1 YceD family protein [Cyanobacteriota bacterium SKYGB_h_bin112]
MDAIHIPHLLNDRDRSRTIQVEGFLPDLQTLTPVKGTVTVRHCGNYLDVSAKAEAIITLTCDRCLRNYNHRLQTTASELIWLTETAHSDATDVIPEDSDYEDLVETLPAQGHFSPTGWLYEQLCLSLPLQQLCAATCPGIQATTSTDSDGQDHTPTDRRWSSLAALRDRLQP